MYVYILYLNILGWGRHHNLNDDDMKPGLQLLTSRPQAAKKGAQKRLCIYGWSCRYIHRDYSTYYMFQQVSLGTMTLRIILPTYKPETQSDLILVACVTESFLLSGCGNPGDSVDAAGPASSKGKRKNVDEEIIGSFPFD